MRTALPSSPESARTLFATLDHCFFVAGVLAFLVWRLGPSLGDHGMNELRSEVFHDTSEIAQ
jgi:hypothetical protein